MRKTLKRNLSYDDRNHLYYVSLYCDGEDGSRVRRTRTYPTMEQAEQVIAEYRRAQLLGGMSAPRDAFAEGWLRCSNDCIATGKGGGSRTLNITPRATSPSTRRESLISRTFCASASRSSSPRRASRRSRSTGCATALRASPTDRMCRCSASRRRWGTAQHPWRAPSQGRSRERQGNRNGSAGRARSSDSSACSTFPLR